MLPFIIIIMIMIMMMIIIKIMMIIINKTIVIVFKIFKWLDILVLLDMRCSVAMCILL